jgi:xylan 1,4-beta-xylosidase
MFHGYEKGFYNIVRQTLLLLVEWTKDDWHKIADSIKDDESKQRPNLVAYNTQIKFNNI